MNKINTKKAMEFGTDLRRLDNKWEKKIYEYMLHVNMEKNVGDITKSIGSDQSTCSQSLSKLKKLGLIVKRRHGRKIFYSINHANNNIISEALKNIV
jgi:predicted transcriptional regulator